jgi:hypothetical protein
MMHIRNAIRRGQLFVRQCGRPNRESDYQSPSQGQAYAMVGVAEIDEHAEIELEAVHDFTAIFRDESAAMKFSGPARPLDMIYSCYDLPTITDRIYQTVDKQAEQQGYSGGGMILRRTRAPSAPGTFIAAVMIVVTLPTAMIPDAHMMTFSSDAPAESNHALGYVHLDLVGPCAIQTNGQALAQVHKSPIWGWSDEPFGFMSLMRLDKIDAASRLQALEFEDNPDLEEIATLRRVTLHDIRPHRDPLYHSFLREMRARGMMKPWDHCPTASEETARAAAADAIVRDLMKAA